MIEKSLAVPKCSRFTLSFPLSHLRAGGKIRRVRFSHMKEESGAIVCAEGLALSFDAEMPVSTIHCTPTELSYYSNFRALFHRIATGLKLFGFSDVWRTLDCYDKNGTKCACILSNRGLLFADASTYKYLSYAVTTCGAIHYERLYFANKKRLNYLAPMVFDSFSTNSTYGGGYIDLLDEAGEIFDIVSYKEKLYLFREHGITALTAYGDPLNFKTASIACPCEKIIPHSVADCGDKIYFLTEDGLHVFNGTVCKKAENADDEGIDLTRAVSATAYRGKYYAAVYNRSGERVGYSYDAETARGRYINHSIACVAANDVFYAASGNGIYVFSGKALPEGRECALEVNFTAGDSGKGETYAESVAVDGTGEISVSIENGHGEKVTAEGVCGKPVRLPRALRGGEFALKIMPKSAEFEIKALCLGMRRDSYDD